MLISTFGKVKWNSKHKKYYTDKGYVFTAIGDEFDVAIADLTHGSKAMVDVQCDYCGEIVHKQYGIYLKQHHDKFGDCCVKCQPIKNKLCCLEKYGVDNGSKTDEAIAKIKRTSLERYGTENPAQAQFVRDKISEASKRNYPKAKDKLIQTNLERYGVECVFANEAIRAQIKNTMLEKYGVEHPKQNEDIKAKEREHNRAKYGVDYYSQTAECRERTIQTNLSKYGYECTLQVPSIREKGVQTLIENQKCPTSKQQIELHEMLKNIYGHCEINYPCGRCLLDCMLNIDGAFVDIEYDGAYWHQDEQRDRRRDEFVKSQGYKVFRIKGGRKLPTQEQIVQAIDYLVKGNHSFTEIDLNI